MLSVHISAYIVAMICMIMYVYIYMHIATENHLEQKIQNAESALRTASDYQEIVCSSCCAENVPEPALGQF